MRISKNHKLLASVSAIALMLQFPTTIAAYAQAANCQGFVFTTDNDVCEINTGTSATDTFNTQAGNDTITNVMDNIAAGTVNMDAGIDTFNNNKGTVSGTVNMGEGNDTFNNNEGIVSGTVNMDAGNDIFNNDGGIIVESAIVNMGDGDDEFINENTTLRDTITINMGAGNDVIVNNAGGLLGTINMGDGDDSYSGTGGIVGQVSMGIGNDNIIITGGIEQESTVNMDDGNDILTVEDQGIIAGTVNMGNGVDTFNLNVNGTNITGTVDGGAGTDVLNFQRSGGTLAGARVSSFETYNINPALATDTWTLTGTHTQTTTNIQQGILSISDGAAFSATAGTINVASGAALTGDGTIAGTVNNAGTVSSTGNGLEMTANADTFNNNDGGILTGTLNMLAGNDIFSNYGTVSGTAVVNMGDGNDEFTNQAGGNIASGAVVNLGAGNDIFSNYGTVAGEVNMGEGVDTFTLDDTMVGAETYVGTITSTGAVNMGNGNDIFNLNVDGANITGTINGGDGTDQLNFQGSGGTLAGDRVSRFETYNINTALATDRWTLTDTHNQRATTLTNGILSISDGNAFNAASGTINFNGGSLETTGMTAIAIDESITLNQAGTINVVNAAQTTTLSGRIRGQGALTKNGLGTLVFSYTSDDDSNDYTGATNVNAGTLQIDQGSSTGTGAVNIANGATLTGDGTIAGTVNNAGTVSSTGNGLEMTANDDTFNNNAGGTLRGTLNMLGGNDEFNNSTGTVSDTAIINMGEGDDGFTNSGTLAGTVNMGDGADRFFQSLFFDGTNFILGTVSSTAIVNMGEGDDIFTNITTVSGTVNMGNGADTFNLAQQGRNSEDEPIYGTISGTGNVNMDAGNDIFNLNVDGTNITGTVDGGAGNDQLNLQGNGGTLDGARVSSFEIYNINTFAATDTWTLTGIHSQTTTNIQQGILSISDGAAFSATAGTINVASGATLTGDGTIAGTVNNAGTVSSTGNGLEMTANADTFNNNDGGILTGILNMLAGNDIFNNNGGDVSGTVNMDAGDDRFSNTGTISGAVNMGNGNDIFNLNVDGANITGTINGGDGTDQLNFQGSGGTLAGDRVSRFETYNINTALATDRWTLTDTHNQRATTLTNGILSISDGNAFNAASGTINFNGGSLETTGMTAIAIDETITLTQAGTINVVNAAQTTTLSGAIGGAGALTKAGAGKLVLTNTLSDYTGDTNINSGILSISNGNAFGTASGTINFNGGSLETTGMTAITIDESITLNQAGTINVVNAAQTTTLSGAIGGAGALTKAGDGTLVLTNANNNYSGETNVDDGTLQIDQGSSTGTGAVNIANGATLTGDGTIAGTVNNLGTVRGTGTGLNMTANADTFNNTINNADYGYLYGILNMLAGNDIFNNNYGEIVGTVNMGEGNDEFTNQNYGVIRDDAVVNMGDGVDTFNNNAAPPDDREGGIVYGVVNMGAGNDIFNNNYDVVGTVNMGDGADTFNNQADGYIDNDAEVNMGAGVDTFNNAFEIFGTVNMDEGADTFNNQAGGTIASGAEVNLDAGNDRFTNAATVAGEVNMGAGVDTFDNQAGGTIASGAEVNLDAGNDIFVNVATIAGTVNMGDGADTFNNQENGEVSGTVNMGDGDDTFNQASTAGVATSGVIDLGAGNDVFALSGSTNNILGRIDGGADIDRIELSGTGTSELNLGFGTNFENIVGLLGTWELSGETDEGTSLTNRSAEFRIADATAITVNGDFTAESGSTTVISVSGGINGEMFNAGSITAADAVNFQTGSTISLDVSMVDDDQLLNIGESFVIARGSSVSDDSTLVENSALLRFSKEVVNNQLIIRALARYMFGDLGDDVTDENLEHVGDAIDSMIEEGGGGADGRQITNALNRLDTREEVNNGLGQLAPGDSAISDLAFRRLTISYLSEIENHYQETIKTRLDNQDRLSLGFADSIRLEEDNDNKLNADIDLNQYFNSRLWTQLGIIKNQTDATFDGRNNFTSAESQTIQLLNGIESTNNIELPLTIGVSSELLQGFWKEDNDTKKGKYTSVGFSGYSGYLTDMGYFTASAGIRKMKVTTTRNIPLLDEVAKGEYGLSQLFSRVSGAFTGQYNDGVRYTGRAGLLYNYNIYDSYQETGSVAALEFGGRKFSEWQANAGVTVSIDLGDYKESSLGMSYDILYSNVIGDQDMNSRFVAGGNPFVTTLQADSKLEHRFGTKFTNKKDGLSFTIGAEYTVNSELTSSSVGGKIALDIEF